MISNNRNISKRTFCFIHLLSFVIIVERGLNLDRTVEQWENPVACTKFIVGQLL